VWIQRVERWRDSGLSAKKFNEQAGVDSDRLRHWKWRLAKESVEPKESSVEAVAVAASFAFVQSPVSNQRTRSVLSGGRAA
jgi:hypothetical protein